VWRDVPFTAKDELSKVILLNHESLALSGIFFADLVVLLVRAVSVYPCTRCRLHKFFDYPTPYTVAIEEGVLHSRLILVESVSEYHKVVAHLPKVHPVDAVHHRVADSSRSSEEDGPVSRTVLFVLHLSVFLTYLTRPLRAA